MRLILIVGLLGLLAHTANGVSGICVTFDKPLLDWKGDFISSNGIFLKNFGVEIQKNCGLCGDCGVFRNPSKFEFPFFKNNPSSFTLSVWFKRRGRSGCMPIIIKKEDSKQANGLISSLDDNTLLVTARTSTGLVYTQTFTTDSQSDDWHHVAMTVSVDKVSEWGWIKVYIDGLKRGQGFLDGLLDPVGTPLFIGGKGCDVCDGRFFSGFIDSVSITGSALTVREVRALYQSRGKCIGQ